MSEEPSPSIAETSWSTTRPNYPHAAQVVEIRPNPGTLLRAQQRFPGFLGFGVLTRLRAIRRHGDQPGSGMGTRWLYSPLDEHRYDP